MNKEKFDELWNKTINSVSFGISAKGIKGKTQINEYLHEFVWNHTWGNEKFVPPERKLLNDMSKEDPQKAMKIESILSNITVSNGWSLYAGIFLALAGIIMLIITRGIWKIVAGIVAIVGIAMMIIDTMQSNINPKKAALKALSKAKEKCDKILL